MLASLSERKQTGGQDVKGRFEYKNKTPDEMWKLVLSENTNDEYLQDSSQILNLFNQWLVERDARYHRWSDMLERFIDEPLRLEVK